MRLPFVMNLHCPMLIILAVTEIVTTLKDVSITIPKAIRKGDNAILLCHYNLEGDTLYSVKWYKGKREFFRYTPKENPALKVFPVPGIAVDRTMSNSSYLTLLQVDLIIAGKYSCEVSADAPSFDTMLVSGELEIVEVPAFKPKITNINQKYRIGEVLNVNCTSENSKPSSNLTWLIDDNVVNPQHVQQYATTKDNKTNLESTTLGLFFLITHKHFKNGKFKITCLSRLYELYQDTSEKYIEEDNPHVLLASASPVGINVNLYNSYDQVPSSLHDSENNEQSDAYMTGVQADMSSSSRPNSIHMKTIFIVIGNIFYNYGVYLLLML